MKQINKCKTCGTETTNKHYCSIKCRDISRKQTTTEDRKCKHCGKEFKVYKKCNQMFCSVKCANNDPIVNKKKGENSKKTKYNRYGRNFVNTEKAKRSRLEKYGVEHLLQSDVFKEQMKITMNKNHGVDYAQQSKKIKAKTKKTFNEQHGGFPMQTAEFKNNMIKKHNVINPRQINGIEDKIKETNNKTYGHNYGLSNKDVINKRLNTLKDKYDVINVSQIPEIREKINLTVMKKFYHLLFTEKKYTDKIQVLFTFEEYKGNGYDTKYNFLCKKCDTEFKYYLKNGTIPRCPVCYPIKNTSLPEKEILDYIQELLPNTEILENDRNILGGRELDIYIPEKNVAIEHDGLYWHSELNSKDKNYHLNKTNECEKQGIQLIHIFGDEWLDKQDIVKHRLKHILGKSENRIYARKCTIKEIDSKTKNDFLETYHIQGTDRSNVKLGLFYDEELVSVMTFGNLRIALGSRSKDSEFELMRFASSHSVTGGGSKLLKYFIKNYSPKKIISYADRRWSTGNFYEALGFIKVSDGTPNYWYITGYSNRTHRFNYRKQVLNEKLELFDVELTEWENMQMNGYDRIWDCGSLKYEKT